jgi:hypothetical protein
MVLQPVILRRQFSCVQVVPKATEVTDTALHVAAASRYPAVLNAIIAAFPDDGVLRSVLCKQNHQGLTPLHCALDFYSAHTGFPSAVIEPMHQVMRGLCELYTKLGINVNLPAKDGSTPLLLACQHGDCIVAEMLICAGADVNQGNNRLETPLMAAVMAGATALLRLLVQKQADVNAATAWTKETVLHVTVSERLPEAKALEIVTVLLEAGADVNAFDEEEKSPVVWAAELGKETVVRCCALASPSLTCVCGSMRVCP